MKEPNEYTREQLYNNCLAYNRFLTIDYLVKLPLKQLFCFVHPVLRDEILGINQYIF